MAFNWKPPPPGPPPAARLMQCKSCGGTDFDDHPESGDRVCHACGTVLQENGIVSTVQFSESGGSSNVVGQFVSGDKGRPSGGGAAGRGRGRFGHSRDSRETTIQAGKKKIIMVLNQLHLRNTLAEPAGRLFSLCVNQNYVQGRKTMNIVAACVYIVCRQKHFPIMLIDISDKLAVNVYVLGKTFQKLVKYLNLQTAVPIVDPAMYIKRFAAKLDLGSKTNAVCMTALKIIGSMKRDFLASGRQPAGVCCAALTLATRVNRIERSKEEIRKAVKVCDATVRKRLLEFEATPTSQLTVEELNKLPQDGSFPGVDDAANGAARGGAATSSAGGTGADSDVSVLVSDVRMDPPSFYNNRIRDGRLQMPQVPWSQPTPPETSIQRAERNKAAASKKKTSKAGREASGLDEENSASDDDKSMNTARGRRKTQPAAGSKKASRKRRGPTARNEEREDEKDEHEGESVVDGRRMMPKRKVTVAASAKGYAEVDDEGEDGRDHDDESDFSPGEEEEEEGDDSRHLEEEAEGEGSDFATAGAKEKGKGKRKRKGNGRGGGKATPAARGKKRRKAARGGESSGDNLEDESSDEESEDSEEDDDEEEDVRLASKMKVNANTDEGREALTRHVLTVRASQNGARMAKSRAKRSKEASKLYSCLSSMFDEDEALARSSASGTAPKPLVSKRSNASPGDEDQGDKETDRTVENDGGASMVQEEADPKASATEDAGDDLEWGMYLRTPEDEKRTKVEWETEHKAWIEDQEEKSKLLAEEGTSQASAKKKRKYGSSSKVGNETFADVLQTEAAKNKSLKIDHAALQRIMNQDGSLKNIDEDNDDEPMEEVVEDNPALPQLLPPSRYSKAHGHERVKTPLAAAPPSSSFTSTTPKAGQPFAGSSVLPPASRSRAEATSRGVAASNGNKVDRDPDTGTADRRESRGQQQEQQKPPPIVKAPWAQAGPDDGGEKAITEALALLAQGGVAALPPISVVAGSSSSPTTPVVPTPAVSAPASAPITASPPAPISLNPKTNALAAATDSAQEEIEGALQGGDEVEGGHLAGTKTVDGVEDDEEEDDDEEDEEEDEDPGLYDEDDDDPYGEYA